MDPNITMALNQEAQLIFTIVYEFFCCTDANKRHYALESLPSSFAFIPWRRVYKHPAPAEAQRTATCLTIMKQHWQPDELPFRGAGFFWCFTVLLRIGETISRKTEEEQTWTSKNGPGTKKSFPDQIQVDRLSTSSGGKPFEMLELTLNLEKPRVALCKIWRTSNAQPPSPHTGASTSHQVEKSLIHIGLTAEMQVDKHQGQLEGEQHLTHDSELSMSGYVLVNSTQCNQNSTGGFIQSTWQDDVSIYQNLHQELTNQEQLQLIDWYSIGNDTDREPSMDNTEQELIDWYSIDNDINYNYFKPDDLANPGGGNWTNFDS